MYKKKAAEKVATEVPGVCERCQRSFKERKYFNRHIKDCGNVICEECNKSFTRKSDLKRDKHTVHGTNPERSCNICSKVFFRHDLLKKHKKKHE